MCVGFSRDGFHWHRPFREAVVPVSNDPNTWNYGNVQSVGGGCLIVGDRLYIYATGRNATQETTGVAFLRRDGFASMDAGDQPGMLTTRPVRFRGKHLFVNVDAPEGELKVEVLGADGQPISVNAAILPRSSASLPRRSAQALSLSRYQETAWP